VAGRPENFSGAIGSFHVTMQAEPTTLLAEAPLTLTVRITGTGRLEQIERPDLRRAWQPRFANQFQIENLQDRYLAEARAREFDYRLRPRSAAVKQVPRLAFVFFKPGFVPAEKGYQTTYAPAIPLIVKPAAEVPASQVQGLSPTLALPDSVYQVVEGPPVLRRDQPWALPALWVLGIMVALPPVLAVFWYAGWRRWYPDAGRLASRRRSRAAQEALRALEKLEKSSSSDQALQAERIVTDYLRQRLDLAVCEPTPIEAATHLQRLGLPAALAQESAAFFTACDAARFSPGFSLDGESWSAAASRLVQSLEDEPWLHRAA
jgi:hypothetical protein